MKTPEEMAEEWAAMTTNNLFYREPLSNAFLAGYQAAKDQYKEAIKTYEDVAKQMLNEALRIMEPKDHVADTSKVMNEFDAMLEEKELVNIKQRDACYRSLNFLVCNQSIPTFRLNDIRSYVGHLEDVLMARNSSNNSNCWISVKDRLPETEEYLTIGYIDGTPWLHHCAVYSAKDGKWLQTTPKLPRDITDFVKYWMPLPKAPKGKV